MSRQDPVAEALAQELQGLGLRPCDDEMLRVHNEAGDGVVVAVRDVGGRRGERVFYVDVGLVCAPWVAWLTHERQPMAPHEATIDESLWRYQVGSHLQGPPWTLRPDNAASVIAAVRARVGEVVREYLPLVDRPTLIDALRTGRDIGGIGNRPAGLVVLLADNGITAEFVERFAALKIRKPEWRDWISNYAVAHTPPGVAILPRPAGTV